MSYNEIEYIKMYLPDDVIRIIKDYSMPLTRPDWKTLHKMPLQLFETEFYFIYQKRYRHLNGRMDTNYKRIFSGYYYCYIFAYN
jgi:hypothetical protein